MSTETPVRPAPTQEPIPVPPAPPRAGASMLGFVLVAAGTLWLLAALGVDLPVGVVTPAVLVALGLGVLVGAVRGEDHAALGIAIFLGVWLTIGAVVTSVVGVPLTGRVGEYDAAPTTAADLDATHSMFAGSQRLDLRGVTLEPGTTQVSLSVVLGEVEVLVPDGMAVHVEAAVAGGTIDLFGTPVDGLGLRDDHESSGYADAASQLELDLRVGLGEVRVLRD